MGRGLIGFALVLLIAVLVVLVSYGGPKQDGSTLDSADYQVDFSHVSAYLEVTRYIDREAGVVCYSVNKGGIDCLPIAETELNIE